LSKKVGLICLLVFVLAVVLASYDKCGAYSQFYKCAICKTKTIPSSIPHKAKIDSTLSVLVNQPFSIDWDVLHYEIIGARALSVPISAIKNTYFNKSPPLV